MKFFIDTASLSEIQEAYDLGVLDGVTTNPSLMAKEGITGTDNIRKHYKAICDIVDDNVSAEVIATEYDAMVAEGRELAKIDDKIVVKIPMIKDGVKAIKQLHTEGIRTNCTLIFNAGQALLAGWCQLCFTIYREAGRYRFRRVAVDRADCSDLFQLRRLRFWQHPFVTICTC